MAKPIPGLRELRRAHIHRGRPRTLSQEQMATALDVSQQTYCKYETGVIDPPAPMKRRIARVLGVELRELWPDAEAAEARA
jgi:DNA-binding XRE family transcriptional regulator